MKGAVKGRTGTDDDAGISRENCVINLQETSQQNVPASGNQHEIGINASANSAAARRLQVICQS